MRKLNGIKLSHQKNSKGIETVDIPLPKSVAIPMLQHMGKACRPIVNVGDTVKVGQLIGDSEEIFSVPVHSSVAGTVTAIEKYITSAGDEDSRVVIETSETQDTVDFTPHPVFDQNSLVQAARLSGISGLGGAGFPTHIKLNCKNLDEVNTLVINGAECEPYITSDYREMLESTDDILGGIKEVMRCLNIKKAIIGIEDNKKEAIKLLKEKKGDDNIEVVTLKSVYPQGAEKVLIYQTTGKIIKEGDIPANEGIIVLNITTVAQLYRFIRTGTPLTHKRITVDGNCVEKPMNLKVPIGTSIEYILDYANIDKELADKILYGGPMMGVAIYDLSTPVIKNTNAITLLKNASIAGSTACIRCGKCVYACPVDLMPFALEKAYDKNDGKSLKDLKVNLCINCGCCSYICPAHRNLAQKNQLAKVLIK